ncbi:hypothetical protein NHF46_02515 [Arthrobacter alpinus]|nr:hypothetical protein [Arthrobacter alpinus]
MMGSSPSNVADTLDPGKEYISVAGKVVPYLGFLGRLGAGLWGGLSNPNGQGMYDAARSGVARSLDQNNNSLILSTTQATFLQAFPTSTTAACPPVPGSGSFTIPKISLSMPGWPSGLGNADAAQPALRLRCAAHRPRQP